MKPNACVFTAVSFSLHFKMDIKCLNKKLRRMTNSKSTIYQKNKNNVIFKLLEQPSLAFSNEPPKVCFNNCNNLNATDITFGVFRKDFLVLNHIIIPL